MNYKQIENLVQGIPIINFEVTLSQVVSLFQSFRDEIISIAIVNNQQKFLGLLRPREILGKGIKSSAIVRNYVNPNVLTIQDYDEKSYSFENLKQLILKSNFRLIPVLDQYDRILGAISDISLLRNLTHDEKPRLHIPVREVVESWDFFSLKPTDSLGTVIAELKKRGYSQIPILDKENNNIIGIVKAIDVLKAHKVSSMSPSAMRGIGEKEKDWYLLPASNVITNALVCSGSDSIFKVIELMIKDASHSLIVEDGERRGIITAQDFLLFFVAKQRTSGFRVVVTDSPEKKLKERAINKGVSVMETFGALFGAETTLSIRFKRNKPSTKGSRFSTTVQTRVASIKGHTFATDSTDYAVEIALNTALDKLYRVLSQEKEKIIDRRADREPHRYPVSKDNKYQ